MIKASERHGRAVSTGIRLLGGTAMAALCVLPIGAAANEAAVEDANQLVIETIVVTATKRGEGVDVQKVPLAVSAFGGDQLEALQVRTLEDLSFAMPNVALQGVGTIPGLASFSIRGQGVNSSIPTVEPTVGVFVDGVYLGTLYGVITNTFDLEAIEVLRGPQGLLFGRNVSRPFRKAHGNRQYQDHQHQ